MSYNDHRKSPFLGEGDPFLTNSLLLSPSDPVIMPNEQQGHAHNDSNPHYNNAPAGDEITFDYEFYDTPYNHSGLAPPSEGYPQQMPLWNNTTAPQPWSAVPPQAQQQQLPTINTEGVTHYPSAQRSGNVSPASSNRYSPYNSPYTPPQNLGPYRSPVEPPSPVDLSPWSVNQDLSPLSPPHHLPLLPTPPSPAAGPSGLHRHSKSLTANSVTKRPAGNRSRSNSANSAMGNLSSRTRDLGISSPQRDWYLPHFSYVPNTPNRPLIPQLSYMPRSQTDQQRYVSDIDFNEPIHFYSNIQGEYGISLSDAISDQFSNLVDPEMEMELNGGSSLSVRLNWPGYPHFTRQIAAKNFKNTPGPVTRSKLAKNVAKTIDRFISENAQKTPDSKDNLIWRVGTDPGSSITTEDLILIGLVQVSKASWQVVLRLNRSPLIHSTPPPNTVSPYSL